MGNLLLVNGHILTLDRSDTVTEALAIANGRIRRVGSTAELRQDLDPATQVVDLGGKTVIPGFIDGHNHFCFGSFEPRQIDCSTPPGDSLADILERIAAFAAREVPGQWIRGWGFHWSRVREQRNPSRWELDEVSPKNPFILMDASYHGAFVNSLALELAGIDEHSSPPRCGILVKDDRGRLNGGLLESAMNVPNSLSWLSYVERAPDDAVALVERNCRRHLAAGITGVTDALVIPEAAALYRRAAELGRLPITVQQMHGGRTFFDPPNVPGARDVDLQTNHGPMLRGGTLKMFMDAVHPGPAMDRCEDGIPAVHTGVNYYSRGEAAALASAASAAGFEVAIHSLGNCAIEQSLDTIAAARRTPEGKSGRFRVEHFIVGTEEQARRAAELGIVVVANPAFIYHWGDMYLHNWRGEGQPDLRIKPLRTLLDAGVMVACASDYPCAVIDPFKGIWSAVTRRALNGEIVDMEEAVSRQEALRMFTINAAIASGRESEEGSLEAGKRANLAILNVDPLACSEEALRDIQVLQTYVDGNLVFDRADEQDPVVLQTYQRGVFPGPGEQTIVTHYHA